MFIVNLIKTLLVGGAEFVKKFGTEIGAYLLGRKSQQSKQRGKELEQRDEASRIRHRVATDRSFADRVRKRFRR